jgi:hypothetical protein
VKEPANRIDPRTVPRSRMLAQLGIRRPDISIVTLVRDTVDEIAAPRHRPGEQSAGHSQSIIAYCLGANPPAGQKIPTARFDSDLRLGVVAFTAGDAGMGLIAQESLWTALGGLETSFVDWDWAIQDFLTRARAIGYVTAQDAVPGASEGAGARLFAERAALAPDRSAPPRTAAATPASRFTVYTAITENYDSLKPQPSAATEGCDQVAFLDPASAATYRGQSRGWRIAPLNAPLTDAHRAARFPKINAHLALPEAEYSLWIDASIGIVSPFPLRHLVELFLGDCDLCLFRHYARGSVYEEAEACKAYGLDRPGVIDAQMARYIADGLPATTGLAEAPILLRRHSPAIQTFNAAWWEEIVHGSRRDQLSLNYAAWKVGLRYATFPLSLAVGNGLFVKFIRQISHQVEQPDAISP